jgi:hypothetical protein
VVCHGPAGHFLVQGVDHALTVRITMDMSDRIRRAMISRNIPEREALQLLREDDQRLRRWHLWFCGQEPNTHQRYDLALHLRRLTSDDAADIICRTVRSDGFRTRPDSQQQVLDLALAADVRAALLEMAPDVSVRAHRGNVYVHATVNPLVQENFQADLSERVYGVCGVARAEIFLDPIAVSNG